MYASIKNCQNSDIMSKGNGGSGMYNVSTREDDVCLRTSRLGTSVSHHSPDGH
jgi:hypothetical protein